MKAKGYQGVILVDAYGRRVARIGRTTFAPSSKRRGYDPLPYLPVIAGRIVGSRDVSNNFLADLRRTVADLITGNYYELFAKRAAVYGLGTHPESGGPHGAAVGCVSGTQREAYLTPMHAARKNLLLLIGDVCKALRYVKSVAEQFPAVDRWKTLLDYGVATISPPRPPRLLNSNTNQVR